MLMSRRGSGPVAPAIQASHGLAPGLRFFRPGQAGRFTRSVLGTLIATSLCVSVAQAATFGHSRIISAPGQSLHLEIPVTDLTQQEIESLRATPAPAEAWSAAGMTPPVALDSMRLALLDGYRPNTKVIRLRSDQVSDRSVVDVLLDIRSASGQQRYQVSLLAHADRLAVQRAGVDESRYERALDERSATAVQTGQSGHEAAGRVISVRSGDTMFAIAQRNAVQGVTVYQMMMALQRSNPQAFIQDNVNLVKAGATLTMPDMAVLTALSDREARRIFQQHAQAFARFGRGGPAGDAVAVSTIGEAAEGEVLEMAAASDASAGVAPSASGGDLLRLSGGSDTASTLSQGVAGGSAASGSEAASHRSGAAVGAAGGNGGAGATALSGALQGGQGNGGPAVNMLASSGVIASDAVANNHAATAAAGDAANKGGPAFGSDASSGGTVVESGVVASHPDDQAAAKKNVEESQKRILELEDNVRHLNEALQKQGHVAAEAALEGARSVSEAIKEVMSLVETEEDGASVNAEGGSGEVVGSTGSTGSAAGPGTALQSSGEAASTPAATASGGHVATPGNFGQDATSSSSTIPVKAGQKVSWFQENMLAILGGGLALVVLLIVWALRRAGAAKRNVFESDSPITDSMLQEKLREIDLDLGTPPEGQTGLRR